MIIVAATDDGGGGGGGGGEVTGPSGFDLVLVGTNGAHWNLADGPVYVIAGSAGIGPTDPTHWFAESPTTDGARWTGLRYANDSGMPLTLEVTKGRNSSWLDNDRALWRGITGEDQCELVLTLPDSTSRKRLIRYAGGGDVDLDVDPFLVERSLYPLTFNADPFWLGDPISKPYVVVTSSAFFPGPPFHIGPSNTVYTSTIDNPGDFPVWPRWVIDGPFTSATVGVGPATVTVNASVAAGESRVIDMDPAVRDITTGTGASAWTESDPIEFARIPAGADVPLNLSVAGASSSTKFTLSFTPLYRRAW